ncbi:MAG: hypothetical protein LBL59_08810 [Xanthomonadaceae bacterium]|jgi:hypothetical protein|nr:hypothetical protein [Xanthomonadaceae bacterium]
MTAKLYALPNPGLADIPALLRNIADELEAGEYGEVREGALVLAGTNLEVFGLGCYADGTVAHYLLACGQRKLESPCLDED